MSPTVASLDVKLFILCTPLVRTSSLLSSSVSLHNLISRSDSVESLGSMVIIFGLSFRVIACKTWKGQ